jgi:hypothetical protein
MWKWITCYLSGRHDYIVSCEPGTIFLKCNQCGRRSNGWELQHDASSLRPAHVTVPQSPRATTTTSVRVLQ